MEDPDFITARDGINRIVGCLTLGGLLAFIAVMIIGYWATH